MCSRYPLALRLFSTITFNSLPEDGVVLSDSPKYDVLLVGASLLIKSSNCEKSNASLSIPLTKSVPRPELNYSHKHIQ